MNINEYGLLRDQIKILVSLDTYKFIRNSNWFLNELIIRQSYFINNFNVSFKK